MAITEESTQLFATIQAVAGLRFSEILLFRGTASATVVGDTVESRLSEEDLDRSKRAETRARAMGIPLPEGMAETFAKKIAMLRVKQFGVIVDAASLVFAHSILDAAAFDLCRVTALIDINPWVELVSARKISLSALKTDSYETIARAQVNAYLEDLERKSLIEKIDRLFGICKPRNGISPYAEYNYDRDRVVTLDKMRHDVVHHAGPISLPDGSNDIKYLAHTYSYLVAMVAYRHTLPRLSGTGKLSDSVAELARFEGKDL
jgi:hypothetical protein